MSILNVAPSICAFIVALYLLPSIKEGVKPIHWIIGTFSLFIMGFSIYQSLIDSDEKDGLKAKLEKAASDRIVDSSNNEHFQKYLKDTFGIVKFGDKAKIVNRNTYIKNVTVNNPLTNSPSPDYSKNFGYKLSKNKDTVTVFPQEGVWIKPFFAFDVTLEEKNANIYQPDGSTTIDSRLPPEETIINNIRYRTITVHLSYVRSKATPLILDISANKNQYIIFGDESDPKKRYFYKNGSVSWVPN